MPILRLFCFDRTWAEDNDVFHRMRVELSKIWRVNVRHSILCFSFEHIYVASTTTDASDPHNHLRAQYTHQSRLLHGATQKRGLRRDSRGKTQAVSLRPNNNDCSYPRIRPKICLQMARLAKPKSERGCRVCMVYERVRRNENKPNERATRSSSSLRPAMRGRAVVDPRARRLNTVRVIIRTEI